MDGVFLNHTSIAQGERTVEVLRDPTVSFLILELVIQIIITASFIWKLRSRRKSFISVISWTHHPESTKRHQC